MSDTENDRWPNGILRDKTLKLIADTATVVQGKVYYERYRKVPNEHQIAEGLVQSDRGRIQEIIRALYEAGWRPPPTQAE